LVGGHTLVQSPGQQPDKCVVLSLQLQAWNKAWGEK
jgi:hypothetical protein